MFSGRTACELWETPDEEATGAYPEGYTIHRLVDLLTRAKGPVRQRWYGAPLQQLWDANELLQAAGCDLQIILDHVEGATPGEAKRLALNRQRYPAYWQQEHIVLGTSRVGGQISHDKELVVNAPVHGYAVPPGDFETVDAALDAGYPVSWFGSWNPSIGASKQSNAICIMPGMVVAQMICDSMERQRQFILANELRYQPVFPPVEIAPIRPLPGGSGA